MIVWQITLGNHRSDFVNLVRNLYRNLNSSSFVLYHGVNFDCFTVLSRNDCKKDLKLKKKETRKIETVGWNKINKQGWLHCLNPVRFKTRRLFWREHVRSLPFRKLRVHESYLVLIVSSDVNRSITRRKSLVFLISQINIERNFSRHR